MKYGDARTLLQELHDLAGEREEALLQQHRRLADIDQGLLALVEDARVPGQLLLQVVDLLLALVRSIGRCAQLLQLPGLGLDLLRQTNPSNGMMMPLPGPSVI